MVSLVFTLTWMVCCHGVDISWDSQRYLFWAGDRDRTVPGAPRESVTPLLPINPRFKESVFFGSFRVMIGNSMEWLSEQSSTLVLGIEASYR